MENINDYISRITKLANRNQELNQQIKELIGRYEGIQEQSNRYHNLLQLYAPEEIGRKKMGRRNMRRIPMVSLLYVSVRGFSKLHDHPKSTDLVDMLDEIHMTLHLIAKKYNCISIKTIGDSFLFAAGIDTENHTNPIDAVNAAMEMQKAVHSCSLSLNHGKPFWELSIGIHTGPVTAEPTGKKNNPFALLGESVNIAYRLGRTCSRGQINLSVMTGEMVKEFFEFSPLGQLPVKYKGQMEMFLFKGILPELADKTDPTLPNRAFKTKYGHIQFMDIQEIMLDRLEQLLPDNLYYHSVKHTIDVVTEAELIGWAEGANDEEILLLKLAGLFHDSGHMIGYHDHEMHGTRIARDMLEEHSFSPEHINTVCRLIMATKLPPDPKDKLEQVMCDSDLDYLGRTDFIPVSNTLYQELKERRMIDNYDNWNKMQLSFIRKHQYFTQTAQKLREVNKQAQIERLKKLLQHEDADTLRRP
ncbi:MAG: adenylate/guanylate cyclase domain-containing protein [Breznakibacter sp.]